MRSFFVYVMVKKKTGRSTPGCSGQSLFTVPLIGLLTFTMLQPP